MVVEHWWLTLVMEQTANSTIYDDGTHGKIFVLAVMRVPQLCRHWLWPLHNIGPQTRAALRSI